MDPKGAGKARKGAEPGTSGSALASLEPQPLGFPQPLGGEDGLAQGCFRGCVAVTQGLTLRKAPQFGLMLCCCCFKNYNTFGTGVPGFHFALGPTEHTAGPGWEGRKGILVLTQRTGKTGLALAAPWAHLILPQGP